MRFGIDISDLAVPKEERERLERERKQRQLAGNASTQRMIQQGLGMRVQGGKGNFGCGNSSFQNNFQHGAGGRGGFQNNYSHQQHPSQWKASSWGSSEPGAMYKRARPSQAQQPASTGMHGNCRGARVGGAALLPTPGGQLGQNFAPHSTLRPQYGHQQLQQPPQQHQRQQQLHNMQHSRLTHQHQAQYQQQRNSVSYSQHQASSFSQQPNSATPTRPFSFSGSGTGQVPPSLADLRKQLQETLAKRK